MNSSSCRRRDQVENITDHFTGGDGSYIFKLTANATFQKPKNKDNIFKKSLSKQNGPVHPFSFALFRAEL